jgi:hypothetical protein
MPSSVIAAVVVEALGLAVGGIAAAAVTFGVRLLTTYVISNLFLKQNNQAAGSNPNDQGSRVQLPPATNNKLPVIYGTTWLKPIITDAKLSIDQKTMWYVCSLCEAPENNTSVYGGGEISFGDIYWGDKKLNFDATDKTKVISWTTTDTDGTTTTDTAVNGLINFYLYRKGSHSQTNTGNSAISILQDSNIESGERWKSTDLMTNTAFMIVKVQYNQDLGLTGLETLTVKVQNTITKPGEALYNYLTNSYYGCGILASEINQQSLQNLDDYSQQQISYTKTDGTTGYQHRYMLNGVIDHSKSCFDSIQDIMDACDSWLQWNESVGKWSVIINKSYTQYAGTQSSTSVTDLFNITDDNVIGSIQLNPVDMNASLNNFEVTYPDTNIYDQAGFAYGALTGIQRNPNEPDNKLSMRLPMVNNSVQAQYLAKRKLLQSREDLIVQCSLDYSGILVNAGDLVRFNSDKFQWVNKVFRVTQVQERKDDQGSLGAMLTLSEFNDSVYQDIAIQDFKPSPNTGIKDPTVAYTPLAPEWYNLVSVNNVPYFSLKFSLPTNGAYKTVEFYYSSTGTNDDDFKLLKTDKSTGAAYSNAQEINIDVSGLSDGSYYFKVRIQTTTGKWSALSPASSVLNWTTTVSVPSALGTSIQWSPSTIVCPSDSQGNNVTVGQTAKIFLYIGTAIIDLWNQVGTQPNNTWYCNTVVPGSGISVSPIVTNYSEDSVAVTIQALTANSTTIAFTDIMYKDSSGNIVNLGSSSIGVTKLNAGAAGSDGTNGSFVATATLYKWALNTPAAPTGSSSFVWASLTNTSYTGTDGWFTTIQANPLTANYNLWEAKKTISAPITQTLTTVDWTTGASIGSIGKNGSDGISGTSGYTVAHSTNFVDFKQGIDGTWSPSYVDVAVNYIGPNLYSKTQRVSVIANNISYGTISGSADITVATTGSGTKQGNITFSSSVTGASTSSNVPVNLTSAAVTYVANPSSIIMYQTMDGTYTPSSVNSVITYANTSASITRTVPVTVSSNAISFGTYSGNTLINVVATGAGTRSGNITFTLPYGTISNPVMVPISVIGLTVEASVDKSYISFPQLSNGAYTSPNTQTITATFKDTRTGTINTVTASASISTTGLITISGANANNITMIFSSNNTSIAGVNFTHTASGATVGATTYAQLYPVVNTTPYGGSVIAVGGANVSNTISSGLTVSSSYSAGQTFNRAVNDGAWTPTPNATNIMTTVASINVRRGNTVVGTAGYNIFYNINNSSFTGAANNTGAVNFSRFTYGTMSSTDTRLLIPVTYTDPEGTISTDVEVNVLRSGSRGSSGPVNVVRYGRFSSREEAQLAGAPISTTGLNSNWVRSPDSFSASDPYTHTTSQWISNVTVGAPAQWKLVLGGTGSGSYVAGRKEEYSLSISGYHTTSAYNNEEFAFDFGGQTGGYVLNAPANDSIDYMLKVGTARYISFSSGSIYYAADGINFVDITSFVNVENYSKFVSVGSYLIGCLRVIEGYDWATYMLIGTDPYNLARYSGFDRIANFDYLTEVSNSKYTKTDLITVRENSNNELYITVCRSNSDPRLPASWTTVPMFSGIFFPNTSTLNFKFYKISNKLYAVSESAIFSADDWNTGWVIVYTGYVRHFQTNGTSAVFIDTSSIDATVRVLNTDVNSTAVVLTVSTAHYRQIVFYNGTYYFLDLFHNVKYTSTDGTTWSSSSSMPILSSTATVYVNDSGFYYNKTSSNYDWYYSSNLVTETATSWANKTYTSYLKNSNNFYFWQLATSNDGQQHADLSIVGTGNSRTRLNGVGSIVSVTLQYYTDLLGTASQTFTATIKLAGNLTTPGQIAADFVAKLNLAKGNRPFTATAYNARVEIIFTYNGNNSSSAGSFTVTQSSGSPASTITITPATATDGRSPSFIEFGNVEIATNRVALELTSAPSVSGNVVTWTCDTLSSNGTLSDGMEIVVDTQQSPVAWVDEFDATIGNATPTAAVRFNTGNSTISINTTNLSTWLQTFVPVLSQGSYIFLQGKAATSSTTTMMFSTVGNSYAQATDIATMFNTQEVAYTATTSGNVVTITSSAYVNKSDLTINRVDAGTNGTIVASDFTLTKVQDGLAPYTSTIGNKSFITFTGTSGGGRFTAPVVIDIDYGQNTTASSNPSGYATTISRLKTALTARGYYVFQIGTTNELRVVDIEPHAGGTFVATVTNGSNPTGTVTAVVTPLDNGVAEIVTGDQYRWTYPVNTGRQIN